MKKNYSRLTSRRLLILIEKIPHAMKLTFLFLVISLLTFTAEASAQRVSISLNNVKVEKVLSAITKQTGLSVAYSKQVVNLDRLVSVQVEDTDVSLVLEKLVADTSLSYEIKSNKIYLFEKQAATVVSGVSQQMKQISGTITDQNGEPVIGANVVEKGTTNGTITGIDGTFSLSVSPNSILSVSYIGYLPEETKVGTQSHLSIQLKEDTQALDEVIVIGYGTAKRKDLTGAVSAVKGDDLANRKTTQLSNALQGAVSGVMVTRDNGAPGVMASSIKVRGVTTIGDTNPLVIIDGVAGNINDVNPNDVENMSVLKDAASASIYGSRAAAGVILITTKRANEKNLALNYTFEFGMELKPQSPIGVSSTRFMEMTNEMRYNDNPTGGMNQKYSQELIDNWYKYNAENPDKYPNTDWSKEFYHNTAPRQSHVLSLTGGGEKVKTNASFTYDKTDALYDNHNYERFMLRVNNDFKFNKYLGSKLDFNLKRSKSHKPFFPNYIEHVRQMPSIYAAQWSDGRFAGDGERTTNPLASINESGFIDSWNSQVGGRFSLDLTPFEGLSISGIAAPIYNFDKTKSFKKSLPYTLLDDPNNIVGYRDSWSTTKLTEDRNDSYSMTLQGIVNYLKDIGKHSLNIMGGYESYYAFWENLMASRDQYELSNYPYLDLGPLLLRDNNGNAQEVSYRSWFGRALYNYDNRYLLQANIRYDGSSRFHKDYRWGAFPSFSAGWVLSEEAFIKERKQDWLSYLKLRVSWGTLGNERIFMPNSTNPNYYPYQAAMDFSNVLFFQNGKPLSILSAAQYNYAIQNISWETTQSFDIGVDAQFLDGRLRFTGDYYKKKTKDMLLALEIPDYVGFENPQKNTGDMYTKGYDLDLGWNDKIGDWRYGISVNFSDFISKMGNLGGTQFLGDQVKIEGSEFNEWYGYMSDGLFLTKEDLDGPKVNNNIKLGDIKYLDISGPDGKPDGKISPEYDRTLLGGSLPRFMFGGNIQVKYKDFDFSMAFQGVGKQNVRYYMSMVKPLHGDWQNAPALIDGKYWSSSNTDQQNANAIYPRITSVNSSTNYALSDFWMFNGRYMRLKNITIGYTLPNAILEKILIRKARVYMSANDLFCISKYPKGFDPEMSEFGYPITSSLLFGLSVNF